MIRYTEKKERKRTMDKKDISMIRKRYKKGEDNFTRIAGCYVSNEKQIISEFADSPHSMPEDEYFRYIDIAKKSLSGKLGNNILMLPFRSDEYEKGSGSGEVTGLLEEVRKSGLKDESIMERYYQHIINTYTTTDNYLIVVFADTYDVPSTASDGTDLDESEIVFDYILTAICPVKLSSPGLGYREDENRIGTLIQEWTAAPVESAFMYPAFSDRCGDVYHVTVYAKKPDAPPADFWMEGLHVITKLSESRKKKIFLEMVEGVVTNSSEEDHDEAMFNVADSLSDYISSKQELQGDDEPVSVSSDEITDILTDAGIEQEKAEKVAKEYDDAFSEEKDRPLATELLEEKLLKNQKLYHEKQALQREVSRLHTEKDKNSNIEEKVVSGDPSVTSIRISPDKKSGVKFTEIDGQKYVVIPVTDNEKITVNGEEQRQD